MLSSSFTLKYIDLSLRKLFLCRHGWHQVNVVCFLVCLLILRPTWLLFMMDCVLSCTSRQDRSELVLGRSAEISTCCSKPASSFHFSLLWSQTSLSSFLFSPAWTEAQHVFSKVSAKSIFTYLHARRSKGLQQCSFTKKCNLNCLGSLYTFSNFS